MGMVAIARAFIEELGSLCPPPFRSERGHCSEACWGRGRQI